MFIMLRFNILLVKLKKEIHIWEGRGKKRAWNFHNKLRVWKKKYATLREGLKVTLSTLGGRWGVQKGSIFNIFLKYVLLPLATGTFFFYFEPLPYLIYFPWFILKQNIDVTVIQIKYECNALEKFISSSVGNVQCESVRRIQRPGRYYHVPHKLSHLDVLILRRLSCW